MKSKRLEEKSEQHKHTLLIVLRGRDFDLWLDQADSKALIGAKVKGKVQSLAEACSLGESQTHQPCVIDSWLSLSAGHTSPARWSPDTHSHFIYRALVFQLFLPLTHCW